MNEFNVALRALYPALHRLEHRLVQFAVPNSARWGLWDCSGEGFTSDRVRTSAGLNKSISPPVTRGS